MSLLNINIGEPDFYDSRSAWLRHGPFAMWLVGLLKPRVFVELGTHTGYSYFAVCHAVQEAALNTKCYAVDTWLGDEHAGFYGGEVYEAVDGHNAIYSEFSTLLRKRFSDALEDIADGSVDLLHIDGRHFYEDVKTDFESWVPKLSSRAVVLFHDTEVREKGFGIWKYWNEISQTRPSINFTFQHGLGVLFWGESINTNTKQLLKFIQQKTGVDAVHELFRFSGESYVRRKEMDALAAKLMGVEQALSNSADQSAIAERDLRAILAEHAALKLSYKNLAKHAQDIEARITEQKSPNSSIVPRAKGKAVKTAPNRTTLDLRTRALRGLQQTIGAHLWKLAKDRVNGATRTVGKSLAAENTSRAVPSPGSQVQGARSPRPFASFGSSEYGGRGEPLLFDAQVDIHSGFDLSIAVHLHLYYIDLEDELSTYLNNIPVPFDLFISVPEGTENLEAIRERMLSTLANVRQIKIQPVRNIGRDLYPFAVVFGPALLGYDLILHIHSKKSPHLMVEGWRRYLLHHTLGNRSLVTQILNRFVSNVRLGAVFPPYYPALGGQPKWGVNKSGVERLLQVLGLDVELDDCPDYPAGSFFWTRSAAVRPLLAGALSEHHFETEADQLDGTSAHAIERLVGFLPYSLEYEVDLPYVDVHWRLANFMNADRVKAGWTAPEFDRDRSDDIASYRAAVEARGDGKGRIAMVTAILGPFDALILPETLEANVDYFCFTDCVSDGYGVFRLVRPPYFDADPRRTARYIKTNVLKYVRGYDHVVWIDANVQLRTKLAGLVERVQASGAVLGAIPHPVRMNCREEAEEVVRDRRDDADLLKSQLARYRRFPEVGYQRLIESNVLVLNTRSTRLQEALRLWWNEINTYSLRDQLSINYALFTAGVHWHALLPEGKSTRDSEEFRLFEHGLNRWWPQGHIYGAWHAGVREHAKDIDADLSSKVVKGETEVDIVICVHNALADVKACLESLDGQLFPGTRIFLVDDASDHETTDFLASYASRSDALLIRHDQRLGYTKAANSGVVLGTARNVLLLNSDTIVPPGAIRKLCLALDSHDTLGIVGPLSNAASTQSVPSIHSTGSQTAINALPEGMTIADVDAEFERNWTGELARVPLVHGFCFAVKRDVFKTVGLFDEVSFPSGYGEENDFCFRAADAGYDLCVLTNTFVYHAKSKSYASDERGQLMRNGSAALARKHTAARVSRAIKTMVAQPQLVSARRLARSFFHQVNGGPAELIFVPALNSPGRPTAPAYIRMIQPYAQPALDSVRILASDIADQLPSRPEGGAIAFLQRTPFSVRFDVLHTWYRQWRADGNAIIYDLDDDFFDIEGVRERTGWTDVSERAAMAEWLCQIADVVTVSTLQLKHVVAPLNDQVLVVPNALDATLWRLDNPIQPRTEGPIRIGYYGTASHDRDMELVAPAIRRLEEEFGSAIDVEIAGAASGAVPVFGRAVSPPPGNIYPEFVAWVLDRAAWDIVVIPLVDDRFNNSKSNLKFLESAAMGAAIVVSDVPTYRDVARNEENCLVVGPNDEAWYLAIRRLIVDHNLRKQIAEKARSDVQSNHTIDGQLSLYSDVIAAAQGTPPVLPKAD